MTSAAYDTLKACPLHELPADRRTVRLAEEGAAYYPKKASFSRRLHSMLPYFEIEGTCPIFDLSYQCRQQTAVPLSDNRLFQYAHRQREHIPIRSLGHARSNKT
eukprot:scaffold82052_cov35-Tisochrysis_lutea.AAC.2